MSFVAFVLAYVLLVPIGAFGAFLPGVRSLPWYSRVGASFLCGGLALTTEAVLMSMSGIVWHPVTMLVVPLCGNVVALFALRRGGKVERVVSVPLSWAAMVVIIAASIHLVLMLATGRATSVDFTYFWGVKAVRFAEAGGVDPVLLGWKWFVHAVPEYPPLVPVIQAFGVLLAGRMPWVGAPLTSVLWLVACLVVIVGCLATRLPPRQVWGVAAFWYTAMALSLAFSYSGANAEAPLLVYETTAAVGVFLTAREREWWPFTALMLAGAAMTKVEAMVVVLGLAVGLTLRDGSIRKWRDVVRCLGWLAAGPAFALALWFGFQRIEGLPVGYRAHGEVETLYWHHLDEVLRSFPSNLAAGSWGLSWVIPLTIVIMSVKWNRSAKLHLPMLMTIAALFAFFVFDYLHDPVDPWERIGWTLPRISQPALSLLILTAGLMASGNEEDPGFESETAGEGGV